MQRRNAKRLADHVICKGFVASEPFVPRAGNSRRGVIGARALTLQFGRKARGAFPRAMWYATRKHGKLPVAPHVEENAGDCSR
jgi:hypothetical protein